MSYHAKPRLRMSLEQVIVRKDGTREDLGMTAYYSTKRICQLFYTIERLTKTTVPPLARWAKRCREYHERR